MSQRGLDFMKETDCGSQKASLLSGVLVVSSFAMLSL